VYESSPIRMLIADEDKLFRDGLKLIFSRHADLRVVAQAADGAEACAKARRCEPSLVLMESRLPVVDGPSAVRQILAEYPGTRVAMLSASHDEADILGAIKAGAHGYITKDVSVGTLLDSVRRVANGDAVIPPAFASRLLQQYAELSRGHDEEARNHDAKVTSREREILRLLVHGATNRDISQQLGIAENTVKVHLRNILEKLQLRNRQQAAAFAISSGLVRPWQGQPEGGAFMPSSPRVVEPRRVGVPAAAARPR
jgi:two-component system nitrate/nitrite response regulator NarL